MHVVLCPNLFGINENHLNNMLTVATGITDVISVHCYCDNSGNRH
jgi:hypothetical protein